MRFFMLPYAQIEKHSGPQGRQVAVSSDAPLVFHPSGSVIQAFHLHEGGLQKLLRGHIDTVNACCYNPITQVYSLSKMCTLSGILFSSLCAQPAGVPVVDAEKSSKPSLSLGLG